jgi:hypothetical protein
MGSLLKAIFSNEYLVTFLGSALVWAGGKLVGALRGKASSKALTAIETAFSIGEQFVISGNGHTPQELITALKGVFAIQLSKVGIHEAARKPWQPVIDKGISKLVAQWYKLHNRSDVPPIAKQLP